MSERTGLGPLELAVLRSVSATAGPAGSSGAYSPTTNVMEHLDAVEGIGPAYGLTVLQDLGSPWRVHLPLFDLEGNWGSVFGDPPADPRYTQVRLSALGALALAGEAHRVGPVPIGLVDGSLYRGGTAPPLDPGRALSTVSALVDDETIPEGDLHEMVGLPRVPTGGTVDGDVQGLYAGRSARLLQSCRIMRELMPPGQALVITGTPLGVAVDMIQQCLAVRAQAERDMERRRLGLDPEQNDYLPAAGRHQRASEADAPASPRLLLDVRAETSGRTGTRLVVLAKAHADIDALERWVRGVWPVTIETTCRFEGGIGSVLRSWADGCRVDRSGLDELTRLIS